MKFGLNFFPSFRPADTTTAAYFDQCLRLAERADALGFNSVKTVEHQFFDYGGHSPSPIVFLAAVAVTAKLYWNRILRFLRIRKDEPEAGKSDAPQSTDAA